MENKKSKSKYINLAGKLYEIPVFGFDTKEKICRLICQADGMSLSNSLNTEKQHEIVVDIIWEGLRERYPDMTRAKIEENLDVRSSHDAILTITSQAGLAITSVGNDGAEIKRIAALPPAEQAVELVKRAQKKPQFLRI